jgi:hypothetical protein
LLETWQPLQLSSPPNCAAVFLKNCSITFLDFAPSPSLHHKVVCALKKRGIANSILEGERGGVGGGPLGVLYLGLWCAPEGGAGCVVMVVVWEQRCCGRGRGRGGAWVRSRPTARYFVCFGGAPKVTKGGVPPGLLGLFKVCWTPSRTLKGRRGIKGGCSPRLVSFR